MRLEPLTIDKRLVNELVDIAWLSKNSDSHQASVPLKALSIARNRICLVLFCMFWYYYFYHLCVFICLFVFGIITTITITIIIISSSSSSSSILCLGHNSI